MDGREITYDKQDASSIMRVTYADTYRVSYPSNAGSGWVTIYVDDATFAGTPCHFRKYDDVAGTSAQDHHNPFVLQCIFEGLAAGSHKFDVYARDVGAGTSYLGWARSYPLLMVEELDAGDPTRSYSNGSNSVSNVTGNGIATGRQVIHNVTQDNATLKVSFSDTFRASYGCNGGSGSVEILMDSASLPVPCEMGMYHDNGFGASSRQDHHWPAHLVCIARGIDAGQHIFNVEWTTYDCGSLYLGWERGQNLLVIEEL
jgi:hypothetical protein